MISYIIKSVLCSGILITVYHLYLESEKMPLFNRIYLLAAIIFSLAVPLIPLEIGQATWEQPLVATVPNAAQHFLIISNPDVSLPPLAPQSSSRPTAFLPFGFALVCGLIFLRFVFQIVTILRLKSQCESMPIHGATLVLVPGNMATYTFLNNIFVSKKEFCNQHLPGEILTHELAHARQMHSLDVLFISLLLTVMWFNPFFYLFRKAIRLNHEFLADEAVLVKYKDVKSYQLLLLDTLIARQQTTLTSSFNYSVTKKRLAMMTTIKNFKRQYIKQMSVALLSAALAFIFSEKIYAQIQAGSKKLSKALPQVEVIKFQEPAQKQPLVQKRELKFTKPGPGISESQAEELYSTIEKYTTYVTNKKGRTDPIVKMPAKMEDHLYELYTLMNKEQMLAAQDSGIIFSQMPVPVKKAPTSEIFENWKRPEIFGIWLNGKHVSNKELNRYKHTDIAEYNLSKLYGGALKGRSYKYQLDLTTNDYFDKTYQERINDRVFIARMSWFDKRPKTFKKSAFSPPIQ